MALGIMRGQFMFNREKNKLFVLIVLGLISNINVAMAEDVALAPVNADSLPINVAAEQAQKPTDAVTAAPAKANTLVSPSQAQQVVTQSQAKEVVAKEISEPKENVAVAQQAPVVAPNVDANATPKADTVEAKTDAPMPKADNDFDFDLKMKSINEGTDKVANNTDKKETVTNKEQELDADLPKNIQYKYNMDPAENLGNSVLSQMDSDLFTQMSEIEKSTTLLTLELRREKILNEIEAQKAVRRKSADDFEQQKAEAKLKQQERKNKIEAEILKEKQNLVDKEKVFEVLKQRKLLNAYMNQMLMEQQAWLKEKESLYAQLAAADQEKKELIAAFKQKLDTVLEASAKNIQTAEAAKTNFERIVKGLKARNEQLRKRIEADAKIIKNAKSNLYVKTQSLEELKDKAATLNVPQTQQSTVAVDADAPLSITEDEETTYNKLSADYAILGITGRSGVMSVDLIDAQGQPLSLKVGSPLPTGHIVNEIGSDYVRFTRDGQDDYLYVGRTIDGVVPTLGLVKDKAEK